MASDKTIELADLAVKTNIHPLYEIEDGLVTVKEVSKPLPVQDYLKNQGRFKHLSEEEIKEIQAHSDAEYNKLKSFENSKIRL